MGNALDILWKQLGLEIRYLMNNEFYDPKPFQFNAGNHPMTAKHRRLWQRLYDVATRHADREIGRFLNRFNHWDGFPNTIVEITSNHGEMLGDGQDLFGHMLSLAVGDSVGDIEIHLLLRR